MSTMQIESVEMYSENVLMYKIIVTGVQVPVGGFSYDDPSYLINTKMAFYIETHEATQAFVDAVNNAGDMGARIMTH